jgi:hypothetical protein
MTTKAKNRNKKFTKKFTEQIHEKLMDLCNLIRPSSRLSNMNSNKRLKPPTRVRTQKLKTVPIGTSLDGPEKDYKGKLSDLYEVDHDDGETYYIDIHTDKVYTADKKYHGRLDEQNYRYDSLLHEPRHRRTYLKSIRNIMRE